MPVSTQIDAQLEGEIGRGLDIPTGGAEAYGMAGRHVAQQMRVATEGLSSVADAIDTHEAVQQSTDWSNQRLQIQNSIEGDGPDSWKVFHANGGTADQYMEKVQKQYDAASQSVSNPRAHAAMVEGTNRDLLDYQRHFQSDQVISDQNDAHASALNTRDQNAKLIQSDPTRLGGFVADHSSEHVILKAAGYTPGQLAAYDREANGIYAKSAVDGLITKATLPTANPAQIDAISNLVNDQKGPIWQNLSPDQLNAANQEIAKARETQGNIAAAVQDVQRPVLLTALRQGDPNAYGTLTQMANNPKGTTAQEKAVYSAEVLRDRDEAQSFYEGSNTISNMSETDARNLVESMPVESARTPQQKGIVEAYKDREEGLNKDPTGWISTHNRTAASAYSAWQQNPNPQTWASFAITQTAIQKKLRPDEPVHLLTPETKAQAQDIVRSITQTPEGASGASKQLFNMAQTFGGSWHSIAHDLMDQHVISREQYAAARLYGDPSRQGEGERILTASAMKPGDRFDIKGVPEAEARKEAQTALARFVNSLGNVNDRADVVAGFTDALTHVLQVNGDTNNLHALATSEANKMLLSDYNFAGSTHTIRVPSGIDSDAVTSASEHALNTIDTHDLIIPKNYGSMNAANHAQNYKRTIQLTGQWYTNEDGSGIKLYDQDMHNVMEKRNGKIVPVELSWNDLTRGNAAKAAQPGQTGEENIATYQQFGR